jgi:hypothetical protein
LMLATPDTFGPDAVRCKAGPVGRAVRPAARGCADYGGGCFARAAALSTGAPHSGQVPLTLPVRS